MTTTAISGARRARGFIDLTPRASFNLGLASRVPSRLIRQAKAEFTPRRISVEMPNRKAAARAARRLLRTVPDLIDAKVTQRGKAVGLALVSRTGFEGRLVRADADFRSQGLSYNCYLLVQRKHESHMLLDFSVIVQDHAIKRWAQRTPGLDLTLHDADLLRLFDKAALVLTKATPKVEDESFAVPLPDGGSFVVQQGVDRDDVPILHVRTFLAPDMQHDYSVVA